MAQGVTLHSMNSTWAMNIFRRKLGLPQALAPFPPNNPARCLFGAPSQDEAVKLCHQVEDKCVRRFSKRWDFNITGKEMPPCIESSDPTKFPSRYEWSEVTMDPSPPPHKKRSLVSSGLQIRNDSSHSVSSRILKQRPITDYMPNKKLGVAASTKGKTIQ